MPRRFLPRSTDRPSQPHELAEVLASLQRDIDEFHRLTVVLQAERRSGPVCGFLEGDRLCTGEPRAFENRLLCGEHIQEVMRARLAHGADPAA